MCFNPRSRKGNDTVRSASSSIAFRFQSTFPQGERLLVVAEIIKAAIGFNPRSRKGNDLDELLHRRWYDRFNPRSRKGNDSDNYDTVPTMSPVSIHVPARGTTTCHMQSSAHTIGFNPRSRKGNDYVRSVCDPPFLRFNPRSRKGNDSLSR